MAGEVNLKDQPQETKPGSLKSGGSRAPLKLIILGCVIAFFLVLAVLIAGTVYAFTSNKNVPVFSSLAETAENLALSDKQTAEVVQGDMKDFIFSSLLSMKKSGSYSNYLDIKATEDEIDSHIVDKRELNSFKYDGNVTMESTGSVIDMDMSGVYNDKNTNVVLDGQIRSNDVTIDLAGELRAFSDKTYVKVDQLPSELIGTNALDSLKGQWLEMSDSSAESLASSYSSSFGLPTTSISKMPVTNADLDKIEEFIDSDAVGDTITRKDDEVIRGVRTNCFEMYLDQAAMKNIYKKMGELGENTYSEEQLNSMTASTEYIKLFICSGRKDGYVYKLVLEMKTAGGANATTITLTMNMWDQNKTTDQLEEPTNAIPFEDAYRELLSAAAGAAKVAGVSTEKDSDNDSSGNNQDSNLDDWKNFNWGNYDWGN